MDNNDKIAIFTRLDWKWLVASYCFLVLFHLTPSYYLISPRGYFLPSIAENTVWEGIGIVIVSVFVALRSRKITILEPAFAALFYTLTLTLVINTLRNAYLVDRGPIVVVAMWIFFFVVGFVSAGFIALLRIKHDAKVST